MKTITYLKTLAISAIVVLSACQKDPVEPGFEATDKSAPSLESGRTASGWKKMEGLPEAPIFNLSYENGEILALGSDHRLKINPSTLKATAENFGSFSENFSTTLNQRFFTKISKASVFVFNTQSPQNLTSLDLLKVDPEFERFISLPGFYSNAIGSTKDNVFLTAYARKGTSERSSRGPVSLVLFRASISKSGNVFISDVKTIPLPELPASARLLTVFAWEEKFIVSFDSKTIVVGQDGFYNEVSDQSIFEIIPFQGLLLGFGQDQILLSRDAGITWAPHIRNKPGQFKYWEQKGFQFGNGLITSSPTEIYQIDLQADSPVFYIKQIPCSELGLDKEHIIYDMINVNQMLFVATSRGIFMKPMKEQEMRKETQQEI